MEPTKRCSKCREEKLISAFGTDQSVKSGIKAECKQCMNSRSKARVQAPKIVVTTKECQKCQSRKAAEEFYKWSRSHDGLQTECKDCHNGRNTGDHPRDETITDKRCTKCGITKLADEFYDNLYARTGIDSWCKVCRKADNTAWNTNNPEKRKPIANRSAKKARQDPDKRAVIYAKTRRWQLAHPEAVRLHGIRDRAKARSNPIRLEKMRQKTIKWFLDRPGYRRAASQRRRALLKGAQITDRYIDIAILYERDHGICTLCHYAIDASIKWPDKRIPTIDHYIPVTRRGDHSYANTKLAHHYCNTIKNNRLETPDLLASIRVRFELRYGMPAPVLHDLSPLAVPLPGQQGQLSLF